MNKNKIENEMYVLYADIMGFKERVIRTEHKDLEKELEELKSKLDGKLSPFLKNVKTFKVSFFQTLYLSLMKIQKRDLIVYLKRL